MTIFDLLKDVLPKNQEPQYEYENDSSLYCRGYNQALSEISSIEIPEDRVREMGYVKKGELND